MKMTSNVHQTKIKESMQRNFLSSVVGISMTKSEFSFATGCSPYRLRCFLKANEKKYARIGYHRWDKLLMPAVVRELCADLGLQVDIDYYTQYVAGTRDRNRATARGASH